MHHRRSQRSKCIQKSPAKKLKLEIERKDLPQKAKVENEDFSRLLNRRSTSETWMVIMKGSTICRELAKAVETTSLRSFALFHEKVKNTLSFYVHENFPLFRVCIPV